MDRNVQNLMDMGFSNARARKALELHGQNGDRALEWLLDNPEGDEGEFDFMMVDDDSSKNDPDLMFALQLQREEQKKREESTRITCMLTGKQVSLQELYILDDCSCKFDRQAITNYAISSIKTMVNVPCPKCNVAISIRDMSQLVPKNVQGQSAQPAQTQPNSFSFFGFGSSNLTPTEASKQATQRLASELQHIMKTNPQAQGYSVAPINNNLYLWELKFFNFDPKEPIAADLHKLKLDHILLHITFPPTYPSNPPFVRVLRPRFQFMTGHVTVGGSICTEMLTNTGWNAVMTVEAVIMSVRAELYHGGARLDMNNRNDYSEQEAREAYERMKQKHGWH